MAKLTLSIECIGDKIYIISDTDFDTTKEDINPDEKLVLDLGDFIYAGIYTALNRAKEILENSDPYDPTSPVEH